MIPTLWKLVLSDFVAKKISHGVITKALNHPLNYYHAKA